MSPLEMVLWLLLGSVSLVGVAFAALIIVLLVRGIMDALRGKL